MPSKPFSALLWPHSCGVLKRKETGGPKPGYRLLVACRKRPSLLQPWMHGFIRFMTSERANPKRSVARTTMIPISARLPDSFPRGFCTSCVPNGRTCTCPPVGTHCCGDHRLNWLGHARKRVESDAKLARPLVGFAARRVAWQGWRSACTRKGCGSLKAAARAIP